MSRQKLPDKDKLKRMVIRECAYANLMTDLDDKTLMEAREVIDRITMDLVGHRWKNLMIHRMGNYDGEWLEIWGFRRETNSEMKRRFARIRRKKEKAAEKKAVEQFKKQRRGE